jgi:hypothetical protein
LNNPSNLTDLSVVKLNFRPVANTKFLNLRFNFKYKSPISITPLSNFTFAKR